MSNNAWIEHRGIGGIDVEFLDSGREPQVAPNPKYPNGVAVSLLSYALQKSCTRNLPYPAPRCGMYRVTCRECGFNALITVAGRADDPNTITLPCKGN
jgi:hypothetical protein